MPQLSFKLGDTEFGVDPSKSSCVAREQDGQLWLSFEANGDKATYEIVTAGDNSQWSWTLYPPRFYGDFPATKGPKGTVLAKINVADLDEYEVAMYLMEHSDVDEVVVELHPDGRAEASGFAHLMNDRIPFQIKWPARKG